MITKVKSLKPQSYRLLWEKSSSVQITLGNWFSVPFWESQMNVRVLKALTTSVWKKSLELCWSPLLPKLKWPRDSSQETFVISPLTLCSRGRSGSSCPAPGNQQLTLSQSCLAPRFFLDQRLVILWGIIHSAHTKQLELELPEGRGRSCPLLHPSIQPWVQCMLAEVTQAGTYTLSSALYHLLNLLRPYYEKLWEEPGKTTPSYRWGNGDAESLNHLFPFLCAFVSAVPLGLKTLPSSFRSQCSCHPPKLPMPMNVFWKLSTADNTVTGFLSGSLVGRRVEENHLEKAEK